MNHTVDSRILFALRLVVAAMVTSIVVVARDVQSATIVILVTFSLCLIFYKLNFTNLWVAFALPWLMILGFSALELSDYSRPVSRDTLAAVVTALAVGFVMLPAHGVRPFKSCQTVQNIDDRAFKVLLFCYVAFSALNVVLAGYIPLVRSVLTGDSGYMDFGVKGIYGLYNAFANAFGLTAFYLWMVHRGRALYRNTFLLVLLVFLLFVTRQNMMSLLVESFIVYCVVVRQVPGTRIVFFAVLLLFGFAMLGDLRIEGDIAEIAAIRDEYRWLPRAFIWLFAYCYFNILNLDNVVINSPQPAFDGGSITTLLPSFLRPEAADDWSDLLEVSSFTVDSFISPLYRDLGLIGLTVVFALLCWATHWYVRRRRFGDTFLGDTGYAVLYFCFLFSFFVNFWFYLPVIFQLVFLPILQRLLFRRTSGSRVLPVEQVGVR